MNSKKAKQLRKYARVAVAVQRVQAGTVYEDTLNIKPKQCGTQQTTLADGTVVHTPFMVQTTQRRVARNCERGLYLKLKSAA